MGSSKGLEDNLSTGALASKALGEGRTLCLTVLHVLRLSRLNSSLQRLGDGAMALTPLWGWRVKMTKTAICPLGDTAAV